MAGPARALLPAATARPTLAARRHAAAGAAVAPPRAAGGAAARWAPSSLVGMRYVSGAIQSRREGAHVPWGGRGGVEREREEQVAAADASPGETGVGARSPPLLLETPIPATQAMAGAGPLTRLDRRMEGRQEPWPRR